MKKTSCFVVLLITFLLSSCLNQSDYQSDNLLSSETKPVSSAEINTTYNSIKSNEKKNSEYSDTSESFDKSISEYYPSTDIADIVKFFPDTVFYANEWDELTAFAEVNNNVPFFTDKEITDVFESYSELDNYGRCGIAYANICKEIMPTKEREQIGQVKPSGWQTSKYDKSIISDMYLYNRCHLIAFMLAGENANEKNLITGTRYFNIEGMLPFEEKVHEYIENNHNNHVLYRVTPMYKGSDLVAQGVLMEAQSVEDDGICFCVWCYNVQPDIEIDYSNGKNYYKGTSETDIPNESDDCTYRFILNENSKKIHLPNCSSVEKIAKRNKTKTNRTYKELISQGYEPCGICKPQN